MMDFLDDNYGLDTIEMGVTIGVAMEAGLLKFGDAEGAINLVKEVGLGTPLGRISEQGLPLRAGCSVSSGCRWSKGRRFRPMIPARSRASA